MNKHLETIYTIGLIVLFLSIFSATIYIIGHAVVWLVMMVVTGPLWVQIGVPVALLILLYNRIYNEIH